jgi:hypothetical protein
VEECEPPRRFLCPEPRTSRTRIPPR